MEFNIHYLLCAFIFCLGIQNIMGQNFCNENATSIISTSCRRCYRNYRVSCPPGTKKLTSGRGVASCYMPITINGKMIRGCQHKCSQVKEVKKCCPGYWGIDCDACPSAASRPNIPCSGHGLCNDTMDGSGECTCQENFTGYACEKCSNETSYGRNCDKECHCVHGKCDNGYNGDGSCDCDSGYNGTICDQEMEECRNKSCPENSRCKDVFGYVMCACNYGYKRIQSLNDTDITNSHSCVPIDACEEKDLNVCHKNASCKSTGPNTYNCSCLPGFHGDGYACDPVDPCQIDNGGCDKNTSRCQYTGPGMHTCKCLEGYEMDPVTKLCQLIDVCSINSSYCSEFATCSVIGPLMFDCTCNEGYGGDGVTCYNNIADLIKDLNSKMDTKVRGSLTYASRLISEHYYDELRNDGPFTLFIPVDNGFRSVLGQQSFEDFIKDADTCRQILRQHILIGEWTLDKLADAGLVYTLQGIPADIQSRRKFGDIIYRYKLPGAVGQRPKTTVLLGNNYAANGIVHVIGRMLTKDPEVKGDTQKSMLELITAEEKYSMFASMLEKADLVDNLKMENITVFAPENSAWKIFSSDAIEHFSSSGGIDALRQILLNHIFNGVTEVSELIQRDRIKSMAGVEVAVVVSEKGQILLNLNISVTQTDIPAKNGLYHHISSLLLPDAKNSLLPSQCDEERSEIVVGPCHTCNYKVLHCPSSTDVPIENEVRTGCRINFFGVTMTGCAQVCNRTHIKRKCCPNFYSEDCHPCPGGFQNPCSGNGQCLDGVEGNGTCVCKPGFAGTICDQCADPNMFGQYCNQTCTCRRGTCNNTIDSDGTCLRCNSHMYSGENCDMKLIFCTRNLWTGGFCHMDAYCDESYNCICKQGYQGKTVKNNLICNEIDNCLLPNRGGCHTQAQCIKTGPGENICRCESGWVGDGKYCYQSVVCNSHRDCHKDGMCRPHWTKTQTICECKEGYHGNGTYCFPEDPCTVNNGNCDAMANCTTLGLGNHTCTCLNGYGGDGYACSPTIYKVVQNNPRLSRLKEFLQKLGNEDLLLSLTDNYTLFAPTNNAMDIVISRMESSYWENPDNILNFIRFHTLPGLYSIKMLLSYQKSHIRMETLYDGFSLSVFNLNETLLVGAREDSKLLSGIVGGDILAVNGYVHIISKALEPFFPPSDTPMLDEFFNDHPEYSQFRDWLMLRNLMDTIMSMNQYTLLVPEDSEVIGHNISFIQSRYLKFYLLPRIRLLSSFEDGETVQTVLGTTQQLKFTRIGNQVFVNNVLISAPNMLTAGGVVHGIDGLLTPVLHQCNVTQVDTIFSKCAACSLGYYECPDQYQQVDINDLIKDCYYPYHDGYSRRGCRGLCEKRTEISECCQGYFGPNCKECPGGAEFPCNNNGVCHTGINGTGLCLCQSGFNGTACEFCNINGTLKAWGLSCLYNNGGCSPNATCDDSFGGRVVCSCYPGLAGDGSQCKNPCDLENGGCDVNAECIFVEGYGRNCSCNAGYVGNGGSCAKMSLLSSSNPVSTWVYGVSVLAALFVLVTLVFIGVFLYLRYMKSSGIMKILTFNRKGSTSSSVFDPLHPDDRDNETMVSQPSTPSDINFSNPLYNVKEEFVDL